MLGETCLQDAEVPIQWDRSTHGALVYSKEAEALETEAKLFEDLEFQQLERESHLEEEREARGQQLLQSRAECHRSIARRKVRVEGQ